MQTPSLPHCIPHANLLNCANGPRLPDSEALLVNNCVQDPLIPSGLSAQGTQRDPPIQVWQVTLGLNSILPIDVVHLYSYLSLILFHLKGFLFFHRTLFCILCHEGVWMLMSCLATDAGTV